MPLTGIAYQRVTASLERSFPSTIFIEVLTARGSAGRAPFLLDWASRTQCKRAAPLKTRLSHRSAHIKSSCGRRCAHDPFALLVALRQAFPVGIVLHPEMADAAARARRWGELVRASGGKDAPLILPGIGPLLDPSSLFVEHVRGVRFLPTSPSSTAAPETYVQMERGNVAVWSRVPWSNAGLQASVAGFLLSTVGALSLTLPPQTRESMLRMAGLWEAFAAGMAPAAPAAP